MFNVQAAFGAQCLKRHMRCANRHIAAKSIDLYWPPYPLNPTRKNDETMNMKKILWATVCCGAAALSAAEGRFTLQSPALTWRNPPAGTKSYVLTVYDPDAPTGIGWTHWVVANIPAATRSLPAAITPEGRGLPEGALQTRNDIGVPGYMGACPPKGSNHRYVFKLTALKIDRLPNVDANATPALVGFFTRANALGEAKFTVRYGR